MQQEKIKVFQLTKLFSSCWRLAATALSYHHVATGRNEQKSAWRFSPEGDGVEDDEQDDAPGFQSSLKYLFDW